MRVTLINFTPLALETLLFTKNTRLKMGPEGMAEVMAWPEERKREELEYMKNTIQSSWEFVDYIFAIEGVSRAFTHQLVRHRVGTSFAQQAQRVVDMTGFEYITGPSIADNEMLAEHYARDMEWISEMYQGLLSGGARTQDARGVLPTNISTNIVFKANLRTLHEMGLKRLCVKAQGEFQDVFRAIRDEVIRVHPWAEDWIRVQCAWNGTCLFPTFPMEECPVKPGVYNPETGNAYNGGKPLHPDVIQKLWETNRAEAQPVVAASGAGTSHGVVRDEPLAGMGEAIQMNEDLPPVVQCQCTSIGIAEDMSGPLSLQCPVPGHQICTCQFFPDQECPIHGSTNEC